MRDVEDADEVVDMDVIVDVVNQVRAESRLVWTNSVVRGENKVVAAPPGVSAQPRAAE